MKQLRPNMRNIRIVSAALCLCMLVGVAKAAPVKDISAARDKGLAWLTKNQAANGSWGKQYTVAVTSFASLAYLAASDEPFAGDNGKALVSGLKYLMSLQKNGQFSAQGHSWIHGQGFATLALSEAVGRSMFCKTKPDIDLKKMRSVSSAHVPRCL